MYKLIVDNIVVDVVKKLRYVRYIPELNKVVITTSSSAHGVCGSDNKTFYALPRAEVPQEKSYWKIVTAVKICEKEYEELKAALKTNSLVASNHVLTLERNRKLTELSEACSRAIISGFSCTLSDGKKHHFRLTIEDQLNLVDVQREFDAGTEKIVFHATNELCQLYNRQDIQTILHNAASLKKHETTYFNVLKNCIYSINDLETIRSIKYGDNIQDLPIDSSMIDSFKELL